MLRSRPQTPPRLARALLGRFLPPAMLEFVAGDLAEEFAEHVLPTRGRNAARRWYWRQTVAAIREARRPALPPPSPPRFRMETLLQDIRFALRSWRRKPAPTALAIVALALGIGANTAIFSVVHGVLIRPLPYPDSEQLMTLWLDNRIQGWHQDVTSYPNFEDWASNNETFSGMAAHQTQADNLVGRGEPQRLTGMVVSPTFFDVLGAAPARGRTFTTADWESDEQLVVLSFAMWQRLFAGSEAALGETLLLDGSPHLVVGVMPAGFQYLDPDVEFWRLFNSGITGSSRGQLWLEVIGRLHGGVTPEQAQADMDRVGRALEETYPDFNEGYGVNVVPLRDEVVGDVRPALLVLLGAVGVVLLIACANVANLMLTRAIERRREMAVRAALGASGGRIARQTLTESLVMAVAGGAVGVAVAAGGLSLLRAMQPDIPRLAEIALDVPVLLFTLVVACVTGLLFGTVPALHARNPDLADSLRERSGSTSGGARARAGLVAGEVALALMLLIGAGLLVRSYTSLLSVSPGYDAEGILSMRVSLSGDRYQSGEDALLFFGELLDNLRALPGSPEAAGVWHPPLGSGYSSGFVTVEGAPVLPREQMREVKFNRATPGYLELMRIPTLRGRTIAPSDIDGGEVVAVVNESFVEGWLGDEDPVGRRFIFGAPENYATEEDPDPELPWIRIVGVVGDVKQRSLTRSPDPELFLPYAQSATGTLELMVRADGDPLALAGAARQLVWDQDPELPVANLELFAEGLRRDTAGERFNLTLVALFAGLALVLSTIGIYGVVAHWVGEQTREIGVRMALGARRMDVLGLVLRQTATVTLAGVAIGLIGAAVTTRWMASLLFGVGSLDPLTFATVALVATVVALLTAWVPARRATAIDPAVALRAD